MKPRHYVYQNLTSAIEDKSSPLRLYLDDRYPNVRDLRGNGDGTRGELRIDGGEANPGTVGAAFDFMVRFTLQPVYEPDVAMQAFAARPEMLESIRAVIVEAQRAASALPDAGALEVLARASWLCALTTEWYRIGPAPGSPLMPLVRHGRFTPADLLALSTSDARRQLIALHGVAGDALFVHLTGFQELALGPTFDGSALCKADADLICDGLLLDIKTRLGRCTESGTRQDSVSRTDVLQLLGYMLFDRTDTYQIRSMGIYSARFGKLTRWDVAEALRILAGESIDVAAERERVWGLLRG